MDFSGLVRILMDNVVVVNDVVYDDGPQRRSCIPQTVKTWSIYEHKERTSVAFIARL